MIYEVHGPSAAYRIARFASPERAIAEASARIYASPSERERVRALLEIGKNATIQYGFSDVTIYTRPGCMPSGRDRSQRSRRQLAHEIVSDVMRRSPPPHELRDQYGLTERQAYAIDNLASSHFGPRGKGYDAYVRSVERILAPRPGSRDMKRGARRDPNERAASFIQDVQRQLDVGDRKMGMRAGQGTVFITLINLPSGVGGAGGGAEAENNRLTLVVRGFNREPGSKVQVETAVSNLYKGGSPSRENRISVRGRTGTEQAIARYVAESLNRIAREVPPNFTHTGRDTKRGARRGRTPMYPGPRSKRTRAWAVVINSGPERGFATFFQNREDALRSARRRRAQGEDVRIDRVMPYRRWQRIGY